jgi:hypothetical protein
VYFAVINNRLEAAGKKSVKSADCYLNKLNYKVISINIWYKSNTTILLMYENEVDCSRQSRPILKFEYVKRKLYYCNSNVYFNRQCSQKHLIPNCHLLYFHTLLKLFCLTYFDTYRGSVLAFSTQVRGFKPGRSRRIFKGEKILSTPSFGGSKAVGPMS